MQTPALKIVFAGTPDFAAVALQALLTSPHQVVAVYTQPDRPSGRGLKVKPSPVKALALSHGLPVHQPVTLKDTAEQATLAQYHPDVMVVAAYGLLLPTAVLTIPAHGCINIHPSLLPRWRGAAPIQRAIHAGDAITGVTIMQMEAGLDTGPILLQRELTPTRQDTSHTLHDKLAVLGASALLETLDLLSRHQLSPIVQDNARATHAAKITKDEALIDWTVPAMQLECRVRAFNPWPVAHTTWQGQSLRIWFAQAQDEQTRAAPGTLLRASREGLDVATSEGVLRLLQLQLPGGNVQSAADFVNAQHDKLHVGQPFHT